MEIARFEEFCQQVLAGECAALLKTLPPGELSSAAEALVGDDDFYAALHSIQIDTAYHASPSQSLRSLLHSRNIQPSALPPDSLGKLVFVEALFNSMAGSELLDAEISSPLLQLKIILCKLFVSKKLFDREESNTIETLMDTLAGMLMGWWSEDIELGVQKRKDGLLEVTNILLENYSDDCDLITHQAKVLLNDWNKEQKRALKLEKRSIETELGRMRLNHCEEVIADLYNSNFAKMTLPPSLYEILSTIWHEVLLRTLLQKSESNSKEVLWKKAAQTTSLMIRSVQPGAHLKSFFQRVENLDEDISYVMGENKYNEEEISYIVEVLLSCQKDMITGQIDTYIQPELIKKGRHYGNVQLSVSAHLKSRLLNLKTGVWYLYHPSSDEKKLIKLVYMDDKIGRVLFSNLNGKIINHSFDELAFHFSSGLLDPVQREHFFKYHIEKVLKQFWNALENKHITEKFRHRVELEKRENKKNADDKEALELKVHEVRNLREKYEKNKLLKDKLTRSVKRIVSLLTLGAWITIRNGDEASQRAKLAVRLVSSGKLIFVDRSGVRIAEYSNRELVEHVISGNVEILHEGDDFNRTLSNVVGRLS